MSTKILILGNSGSGKSTAIRNLDPNETFILKCINKEIPIKGSSKKYSLENKNTFTLSKDNIFSSMMMALKKINENKKIKVLVIDDLNYFMLYDYLKMLTFKEFQGNGTFTMYRRLATNFIDTLNYIDEMREDLLVFINAHYQVKEQSGDVAFKTVGKFIDEQLVVEGLFTIVLRALGSSADYKFKTNRFEPAKSPMGMFPEEIENDFKYIKEQIYKFYEEE